MRFIPFERETIVLPVSSREVVALIGARTQTEAGDGAGRIFKGIVKKHSFTITLRSTRAQIMIPQVHGEVDDTSAGCVVFLKYRFFPQTNFFLVFWTVVSLALALLFLGPAANYLYGCLALAFCVANYLVAMANFEVHRKQVRKALAGALEQLKS